MYNPEPYLPVSDGFGNDAFFTGDKQGELLKVILICLKGMRRISLLGFQISKKLGSVHKALEKCSGNLRMPAGLANGRAYYSSSR
jgi:hypothetical protein